MSEIRFDGQVAIITGAGQGLGRSHALELARRGAKIVVNDLGAAVDGAGTDETAAASVVREIEALGGEAFANGADVTDEEAVAAMVAETMERWGRIDILINNAGVLRDKSFSKMTMDDFRFVIDVHLIGTATCTKAVWDIMKEQGHGRILVTSSPSGLYGIFGQANYGAAKAGMIGFMNALHLEGAKYDIRINALSPSAATRMTEDLGIPDQIFEQLTPESVTAAAVFLVGPEAPSRCILSTAMGCYSRAYMLETEGVYLPPGEQSPESIAAHFETISERTGLNYHENSNSSMMNFAALMQKPKG